MEYILNNSYKYNNKKYLSLFNLGISFIGLIMPFIINKEFFIWYRYPAIILLPLFLGYFFERKTPIYNIIVEKHKYTILDIIDNYIQYEKKESE